MAACRGATGYPGDQLLWDLLAVRANLQLVTGDKPLSGDAGMEERVMSPLAFVSGQTTRWW